MRLSRVALPIRPHVGAAMGHFQAFVEGP
jgi:hypothetical protein